MSDLTTATLLKAHLKITSSTDDALLAVLVSAASAAIEKYCDDAFNQATYTETYDGNGEQDLVLRHRPIISVTSLYVDTNRSFGSETLLVEATDFVVYKDPGILHLLQAGGTRLIFDEPARFPESELCVRVTYVAGYATLPADLVIAANELAAHYFYNRGANSNVKSHSIGAFSETFGDAVASIPAHVKALLVSYRNETLEDQRVV